MNQRPSQLTRFRVMAAMALAVLAIYLVVLFNTQVVHHEEYLAKSIQTITRMENVEASRGIITDRSGRTLVTNQSTYSLTFDASLLKPGENQNDAILRLVTLCRDQGVAWEDNLPLSLDGAAHFTVDTLTDTQKSRFFSYLRDLKPTRELLATYVRQHPELLKPPKEGEAALDPATAKDTELLKQTNSAALTNSLLLNAGQAIRLDAGGYEALRRLFRQRRPPDLGRPVRIEAAEAGRQQQRLRSGAECRRSFLLPHQRRPVSGGQDHPLLRPAVRHHLRCPYFRHRGRHLRLYR